MSDTGWMTQGACLGVDPEVFHPEQRSGGYGSDYARARAVCSGCDVINKCLAYALAHMVDSSDDPADHGIGQFGCWGGTTPAERRAIRRAEAA